MKASLNLGLSYELRAAFAETLSTTIVKEKRNNTVSVLNGFWMGGFTSGEGCFFVNIFKSAHHKVGYQVRLEFELAQHIRDELLMESFTSFFNCGVISRYSKDMVKFRCTKLSDISTIIIPFFKQYLPEGNKMKDFEDFCKVAEFLENKYHLTEEGLQKIRDIKARMNSARRNFLS